jgi:hypothetical protein
MLLGLLPSLFKTGAAVYGNHQASKVAMSQAKLLHSQKMASGEIDYQGMVMNNQNQGWKDEFVLVLVSSPIMVLIYSIFTDDPEIRAKLDMFFEYFSSMPFWYQGLFIGVVGSIYGLKGMDLLKRK